MVMSVIRKRRSIRKFGNRPIEPEKVDMLIEAALRAPSSRGLQPWEFVVVTDKDLLQTLSRAKPHGSAFVGNAPLGIVVCADPDKSDVWIEDSCIAAIFVQLAAESLGLGSCWIQIRERMHKNSEASEEYISKVLRIPRRLRVEAMIAIGYPDEEKPPHEKDTLHLEKVYLNQYGKAYET
jgi:nitroreductase